MDRSQHQRYLTYLKKYEYFGRGRAKLGMADFLALEAELFALDSMPTDEAARRAEILKTLLRA